MAFDGMTLNNILTELKQNLIQARVEKIYVSNKNELYFIFHTQTRKTLKLLISIDANNARIHFTQSTKENPIKAPQICMILRKHLQGAKLVNISQYGLDRVAILEFQNFNELGDLVNKTLAVELMGKYSNVILMNEQNVIIDAMRHVDITMSSVREVLPNKHYSFPSTLGKEDITKLSLGDFQKIMENSEETEYNENLLSNHFIGFSKSFSNFLLEKLECNHHPISFDCSKMLYDKLDSLLKQMQQHSLQFELTDNQKDYTLTEKVAKGNEFVSFFLDDYYQKKESVSILKMAKLNLRHEVESFHSKIKKKLSLVNQTINDSTEYDTYRIYGELLTCNLHQMETGMKEVIIINYYDDNNKITIPLQSNLPPSKNAQLYFKKYNKAKSSYEHAQTYKAIYEKDFSYLSSVLYEIDAANTLEEIDEVREELFSQGYLHKKLKNSRKNDLPSEPLKYEKDSFIIWVGKNNMQNDKLTFKIAKKNDTWLHTKGFHGSHVIIQGQNIPEDVLYYAATLAVSHSEAKNSSKVEVDYCLVKNVHKENGSKPGMVVYTDYHTIVV